MLRYNSTQKYVTLDFETEGLNLVYSRPFQASWIVSDIYNTHEEHDFFIRWPDLKMSDGAAKITGFDREKYDANAVDPLQVLELMDKYIYDPSYKIVGQNILGFDIYIHNILRKACGFKTDYSYLSRLYDTKQLSRAKNLEIPVSGEHIYWQYRVNSVTKKAGSNSQLAMLKEHKIPFDEKMLHNSLYDVKMTFEIFKKLIGIVEI